MVKFLAKENFMTIWQGVSFFCNFVLMNTTYLYIGLGFVVLGFLLKAFPNLIAGYNSMSKEQKEEINIKGLSSNMRNAFIIMGLSLLFFVFGLIGNWRNFLL